ncbi:MAG: Lrp/AsnC family transcriptional regulator [Rhodoferax sp.]|jgi:DNA-binding Lrp family transcriptional regulator|nr:Lrp/AsnC family transcriptional regulator [Rhodoferax sp.]MCB2043532.1 Lrp/AsnC family transcriptional regulator [Rhodoferax sp.]MCP5263988.1 Lrp/AsnC family transcriptional regulator [Rhodoferax sp.]MCW5627651.1 Lrp/AsnC family transcriptional regulator [Rhodoferax sp.]
MTPSHAAASVPPAEPVPRLLNAWQHGFPLVERPFDALGLPFGLSGAQVRATLRQALARGEVSRVGAVFGVGAGGNGMLCAMQVPPHRLESVAALVNAEAGVNHNYAREHRLNLWFVATAPDARALQSIVARIEQATALDVLRLPMRRAYRIDLGFDLFGAHAPHRAAANDAPPVPPHLHALAARLEDGLQLVARPYAELGAAMGMDEPAVLACLRQWCAQGTVRRLGVILRHHEFGVTANAMTVFDLPADAVDAAGARLAAQPGVNLCYRRSPAPGWPYTLYCMVHGRERAAVRAAVEAAAHGAGLSGVPRELLFSSRRFKQTGGRYFTPTSP